MADVSLVVTPRGGFGKGPARQLRRSGLVPAVFMGTGWAQKVKQSQFR